MDNPKKSSAELCIEFCQITNTSFAVADDILRKNGWNLEASLNEFFNGEDPAGTVAAVSGDPGSSSVAAGPPRKRLCVPTGEIPIIDLDMDSPSTSASVTSQNVEQKGDTVTMDARGDGQRPDVFRIVSWNVDGLDDESLTARTHGVINEISLKKPDVVFLQEVVQMNLDIFEQELSRSYIIRTGGTVEYFTATLLAKETMKFESDDIMAFPNTRMGRNLLITQARFDGVPLTLINSHLESTKDFAGERKNQLAEGFTQMREANTERTVIFGGDLNLRDNELKAIGGIPQRIVDLYTVTGSRPECACTWDTQRNTNAISKVGKSWKKVVCRFDRLYFRPSESKCALVPLHFNLVGLRKAPNSQKFPSDHWGVLVTFDRLFHSG